MTAVADALLYALDTCAALVEFHAAGGPYRELAPANILHDRAARRVQLAAAPAIDPTYTYASPERTGRVAHAVDPRADLYALGAILHELVAGAPPFQASDALGMIHAHIAKPPPPVAAPRAVADLIARLLAKDPDDRYQTAGALAADLQRCVDALARGGSLDELELSAARPPRLRVPERLYGRDRECARLAAAIAATVERDQLLVVRGSSGVGKSALIREVRRLVVDRGGMFAEGKFDQFQREVPYSALRQALAAVVTRLLSLDEVHLAPWRVRLAAAVEHHGRLMLELVPGLELVIGPQPVTEELPPAEARRVFERVFVRFVHALGTPAQPLALFVDDLQWVDLPTLALLRAVLGGGGAGVLLLGAYRRDDVYELHPLATMLRELRTAWVTAIDLEPLATTALEQLLSDTLARPRAEVEELAELLAQRSAGNPLFATQLLVAYEQEGLIRYVAAARHWDADIARLRAARISTNVLELMVQRLARLPSETRAVLRVAACLGATFSLRQLARLRDCDASAVESELRPALEAGLVMPDLDGDRLGFVHDRVQQAATAGVGDAALEELHLRIGRSLELEASDRLFDIVGHKNAARRLITDAEERRALLDQNLGAAERAQRSIAFEPMFGYASVAAELLAGLPDAPPALTDRVGLCRAEACHLTGRHADVIAQIDAIIARATDPLTRIAAHKLLVLQANAEGRTRDAAHVALRFLRELGIKLPQQFRPIDIAKLFIKCRVRLVAYSDQRLLALPENTDPIELAIGDFIMLSLPCMSYAEPLAFPIVLMRALERALASGLNFTSPMPFMGLAIILARVGQFAAARRFEALADRLQARFQAQRVGAYLSSGGNIFLTWLVRPSREVAAIIGGESYAKCLAVGNHDLVANELINSLSMGFLAGEPVARCQARVQPIFDELDRLRQWSTQDAARAFFQLIEKLHGDDPDAPLSGTYFEPISFMSRMQEQGNLISDFSAILAICYDDLLFGDGTRGRAELDRFAPSFEKVAHLFLILRYVMLSALIKLRTGGTKRDIKLERGLLRRWANEAPELHGFALSLVDAELAARTGNARAPALFDEAVRRAVLIDAPNDAALGRELAAGYFERAGDKVRAEEQIALAAGYYRRWGARAKLVQLARRYPGVVSVEQMVPAAAPAPALDVSSLSKAARALSGEIILPRLLDALIAVIVESAGASAAAIVLSRDDDEPRVEGRVRIPTDAGAPPEIHVMEGIALGAADVPRSAINYVIRTGEDVELDAVREDPYFAERDVRSAIAIAIRKQGQVIGVLYLENALIRGAFTAERVEFLTILAGQVAISIENALLYESLERKVDARTAELRRMQEIALANAHAAGMAQIATDVLHNVGNVLNSVTVSCEMLHRVVRESRIGGLVRASELLDTGDMAAFLASDKGKKFPAYLTKLAAALQSDQERAASELDTLRDKVGLIAEIVASQQSYAKGDLFAEDLDLSKLVEDALQIQARTIAAAGVRVVKRFASLGPVRGQRTKVAHVLVNLVKNACEAMAQHAGERTLAIAIDRDASGAAIVEVRDSGAGIAPEDLARVFQHGFTTKPTGHGFGLHSCANAMTELGGSIRVRSDGPGRGASFTLVFAPRAITAAA